MKETRSNSKRKPLVVTPGDPAGIGPDIAVMLQAGELRERIVIIADRDVLRERANALGQEFSFPDYREESAATSGIEVLHVPCSHRVTAGKPDPGNAGYILNTLENAIRGCLGRKFGALITGPVNKETIRRAGIDFSGHTEFLAERTQSPLPVMLLTDEKLRVALVTTHLPLAEVSAAISQEKIVSVARILNNDLKLRFHMPSPRIGVCGLNPHAGEGGTLGTEDVTEILPAVETLRSEGVHIKGPYPADTIFIQNQLRKFDVVLAMYHDQGLPVIKHSAFGHVVNVTLGLPIIRTSVDHGTAYDIAGTGNADIGSMMSAIELARNFCRRSDSK